MRKAYVITLLAVCSFIIGYQFWTYPNYTEHLEYMEICHLNGGCETLEGNYKALVDQITSVRCKHYNYVYIPTFKGKLLGKQKYEEHRIGYIFGLKHHPH